jgi:hypothetical protein
MPDIHDVMDVAMDDLSPEHQIQLKDAIDQFQQKCLMAFGKNRSGVPYLKSNMPRVLLPGEPDTISAEEKQEAMNAVRQNMENIMAKHHTAFLSMFKQMMVGVFGPGMERMIGRVSPQGSTVEVGEMSAAVNSQPARDASAQPPLQSMGSQPIQPPPQRARGQPIQPPLQSTGGHPIQQQNPYQAMPNRPTYGDLAFGSSGVPPGSTYRIAPVNNRLQKNMFGEGYSEFMDYGAIDAFPNPGYGTAAGMPTGPIGRPGDQDANVDLMVQKMADVLQNQFGLKHKNQGQVYTPPFPEWYNRVALPQRVKPPADFTKFSGQVDTSTMEHIARYLMQLGEASADEAFRIRYFPLSLTGLAFTWFASLAAQSICTWKDLEQKFHAHYFIGSNEKKLIDLTTLRQRHNETPMEFLRRFRETKSMCFSLNLPDDQLADMAVAGMLPAIREKLFGMEFDNLGELSHGLSSMSNQDYGVKKDSRFVKHNDIADIYNQFLERADQEEEFDDEEEIASAEMVWGKEPLTVNQRWIK